MEIWRETQVAEVCFVVCLFSLGYEVYLPTEGATHTPSQISKVGVGKPVEK